MPSYARRHQLQGSLTYHIFNRSNGRIPIFNHDDDFACFKDLIKRYKEQFNLAVYHWVIMSNHFHLLVEIERPETLPKIMAGLARAYSYYYHRRRQTSGYLWQGRYKAQAIQKGGYLMACGRYIERNPVEASLVTKAYQYRHSSARYYCLGEKDDVVNESHVYREFGASEAERQQQYQRYLEDFDKEEKRNFDEMERPMGNEIFRGRLVKQRGHYYPRRRGKKKGWNKFVITSF